MANVRTLFRIASVLPVLVIVAHGQKPEFEAASIRVKPQQSGFHFASDSATGGPGTSDPGMYRCTNCTLATLIAKAYNLQNYQFPGRTSLPDTTFDVSARIPAGATREDFLAMQQNLLKDRFGLTTHFTEKNLRGYHLTVAAKGSKLKESAGDAPKPTRPQGSPDQHWQGGGGEAHKHSGPMIFNGSATFRGDHQSTADIASLVSDQLGLPVDDQTGLPGKYDVELRWTSDTSNQTPHTDGAWGGHDHGGNGAGAPAPDGSGPTLFEALQAQLGLKLVPASQAAARILVIDHVQPLPTEN